MVSIESPNQTRSSKLIMDPPPPPSGPRISFSADFLDDDDDGSNFISISPNSMLEKDDSIINAVDMSDQELLEDHIMKNPKICSNFEFLLTSQNSLPSQTDILTADELFFEGKLLPFWKIQRITENLEKQINLKANNNAVAQEEEHDDNTNSHIIINNKDESVKEKAAAADHVTEGTDQASVANGTKSMEEPRIWFIDDDPSPRPPKCTVLWKELLRLKKQRSASTLSPSSSSSSSSSSSLGDHAAVAMDEENKDGGTREKHMRRIKKGLEKTRSASIRIRPMINVPICSTQGGRGKSSNSSLPPLFPTMKRTGKSSGTFKESLV